MTVEAERFPFAVVDPALGPFPRIALHAHRSGIWAKASHGKRTGG